MPIKLLFFSKDCLLQMIDTAFHYLFAYLFFEHEQWMETEASSEKP